MVRSPAFRLVFIRERYEFYRDFVVGLEAHE
jgi:hypothetical protein